MIEVIAVLIAIVFALWLGLVGFAAVYINFHALLGRWFR
jgi:hypothetical protein